MVQFDEPIVSSDQDEFFRAEIAKRCAGIISEIRSDSAFVLGLSGQWGAGKTSFINMVKEALAIQERKTIVVSFNAWLYSSQEQLMKQFFEEVNRAIGKDAIGGLTKEAVKELGAALCEYSDAISRTGVAVASLAVPLITTINEAFPAASMVEKLVLKRVLDKAGTALKGSEKTIGQLRSEISKRLSRLDENIVVIIDDVDRLPKEDICALFKLVNLTASFPRMTYLLSYDSDVVCNVLSDVQGIEGSAYLEKIVQLPVDLPQPPSEVLRKQIESVLTPHIESQRTFSARGTERVRLLQVFEPLAMRRILTPRGVKRFLNKFHVICTNVGEEICPTDVIAMTGVMLYFPNVARWIWKHKADICSGVLSNAGISKATETVLMTSLREAVAKDADEVEPVVDAMTVIFPKIGTWESGVHISPPNVSRLSGRVAHIANLELFFSTSDGAEVKRTELYELVMDCDADTFTERLLGLDSSGELGQLLEAVDACRATLSPDREELIAGCLLRVLGQLNPEEGSLFFRSQVESASHLLTVLLGDVGVTSADALVRKAMKSFYLSDYLGLSWFLREEVIAQSGEGLQACLSSNCFADLANTFIRMVVDNYPSVLCLPDHPAKFLWRHLDELLNGSALLSMRERYSGDLTVRILCAAAGLAHWSSGLEQGYGYPLSTGEEYVPVFESPTVEEVSEFGKTARFGMLSDDMRLRVASLYLLLRDSKSKQPFDDMRVTWEMSLDVLDEWEGLAAHA